MSMLGTWISATFFIFHLKKRSRNTIKWVWHEIFSFRFLSCSVSFGHLSIQSITKQQQTGGNLLTVTTTTQTMKQFQLAYISKWTLSKKITFTYDYLQKFFHKNSKLPSWYTQGPCWGNWFVKKSWKSHVRLPLIAIGPHFPFPYLYSLDLPKNEGSSITLLYRYCTVLPSCSWASASIPPASAFRHPAP